MLFGLSGMYLTFLSFSVLLCLPTVIGISACPTCVHVIGTFAKPCTKVLHLCVVVNKCLLCLFRMCMSEALSSKICVLVVIPCSESSSP